MHQRECALCTQVNINDGVILGYRVGYIICPAPSLHGERIEWYEDGENDNVAIGLSHNCERE